MKKILMFLMLFSLVLTVMVACGSSKKPATTTAGTTSTVSTSSADGTTLPDAYVTTLAPDSSTSLTTPDGTTKAPEGTTKAPEVTTKAPEDTTAPQITVTSKPQDTTTIPQTTVKDPVSVEPISDLLYPAFEKPAADMTSKPLWFWNTSLENMTEEKVREIVRESYLQTGYSGFGILPYWLDGYLGERYFELYGAALDEGSKYGMQFSLYDENGFPSYTAGGILAERYPLLTAKRLDMVESNRAKDGKVFLRIPQGVFMGAVAWNTKTNEILDISDKAVIVDLGEFDPDSFPMGAVASSTYAGAVGYEIDKAFDGKKTTRWNAASASGSGSNIIVHFEKATDIDEVVIFEPADAELERVQAYTLSYYNEAKKEWVELAKGTTITRKGQTITFDKISTSFLRISFDKVKGDSVTISEMEIKCGGNAYAIPTTPQTETLGGYSSSSDFSGEYIADFAFDGDASTRWNAQDGQRVNQWLAIDYGKEQKVDSVTVSEAFGRVTSFAIQYKNADGTWVDCYTGTKLGANFKAEFTPVTTTSIRLLMKSVSSDTASIYEIKTYFEGSEVFIEEDNSSYRGSYIEYAIPSEDWKVMAFVTVKDGHKGMDYLSEESVAAFIEITYEEYYKRFKKFFDNGTITSAFYDEPCFWPSNQNYGVQGARTWTGDFNEYFASMYGKDVNPILYYPAMWYDIGEKTAEARDALNRVRTEMFAKNYIGQMNDWCAEHGLELLGHMNCEDVESPLAYHGDLMYCFKYQSAPSVDVIYSYGMTEDYYKVISSSAYNWDKPHVGVEAYGATNNMPVDDLYKTAMDLYAKGINVMVPHAVWYDHINNVVFPPELSYRTPKYADALKVYNQYIARLSTVLQEGRHIADVAVLYPIDYMESVYLFNNQYNIPADSNYVKVTEMLSENLRIDFTYLHPTVLDEKVSVNGNTLHLDNKINYEDYKVIILPSMGSISLSNLQKIKAFYDAGGVVISVGTLPTKGTLAKDDAEVKAIITEMFGSTAAHTVEKTNEAGGKVFHINSHSQMTAVMAKACSLYDVNIEPVSTRNGHFTYIHKFVQNRNVWFFANSSSAKAETTVTLRGEYHALELWDPMTGERRDLAVTVKDGATTFALSMDKVTSVFVVEKVK